jgi:hypothetical protein
MAKEVQVQVHVEALSIELAGGAGQQGGDCGGG